MIETNRVYLDKKPEKLQYLGNNKYYYNYDIQEEQVEDESGQRTVYSCIQVKLVNKPDYKRCVRAVIRKFIDIDEEFDLINSYIYSLQSNGVSTLSSSESRDSDYEQYLSLVNEIKANVTKDFA